MNIRTAFTIGSALVLSVLAGCATPPAIQTISPKPVPPAAGHITTAVYVKDDVLPHDKDGVIAFEGEVPQVGGLLHDKGYVVAAKATWLRVVSVDQEWITTPVDGVHKMIHYWMQDRYANLKVPPASSADIQNAPLALAHYAQTGVFDMDGGVIANGASATGSLGGGLVIGLIASAAETVAGAISNHEQAEEQARQKKTERFPENTAILIGRIRQGIGGSNYVFSNVQSAERRVIVTAWSDAPETPAVLMDAALRRFVDVFANGYKKASDTSKPTDTATHTTSTPAQAVQ